MSVSPIHEAKRRKTSAKHLETNTNLKRSNTQQYRRVKNRQQYMGPVSRQQYMAPVNHQPNIEPTFCRQCMEPTFCRRCMEPMNRHVGSHENFTDYANQGKLRSTSEKLPGEPLVSSHQGLISRGSPHKPPIRGKSAPKSAEYSTLLSVGPESTPSYPIKGNADDVAAEKPDFSEINDPKPVKNPPCMISTPFDRARGIHRLSKRQSCSSEDVKHDLYMSFNTDTCTKLYKEWYQGDGEHEAVVKRIELFKKRPRTKEYKFFIKRRRIINLMESICIDHRIKIRTRLAAAQLLDRFLKALDVTMNSFCQKKIEYTDRLCELLIKCHSLFELNRQKLADSKRVSQPQK